MNSMDLFGREHLEATRGRTVLVRTDEARGHVRELVKQLIYGPLIEWLVDRDEIERRIMDVVAEIVKEIVNEKDT